MADDTNISFLNCENGVSQLRYKVFNSEYS